MRTKLATLRKSMGLSQEMMAERLSISRSHYSQIEAGDRCPSLRVALRIKQVCEYTDDDIFLNFFCPRTGR